MHSQTYLAAACALLSAVAAQPAPGLDTVTHIDYVTEMVTSTVWVDAGDPRANQTPAPVASASKVQNDVQSEHQSHSHGGAHSHGHESSSSSSVHVVASPPAAAAPSSSSSVIPPPPPPPAATSSTSVVAPAPAPVETHATTPTTVAPPPAAPTTSTPAPPPPAPTTSTPAANIPAQQAPASSSPAAAATTAASSGSGEHYTNKRVTFYGPNGGYGSCGWVMHNTDIAVALSAVDMDKLGKANVCGKYITINVGSNSTVAQIADTCPGCPEGGLDLTSNDTGEPTGTWAKLGLDPNKGHYENAEWWFN